MMFNLKETTMSFVNKSPALKSLQNDYASQSFGMSISEALKKHVCVICKKPPIIRTKLEDSEYYISAMCGPCWDETFKDA